MDEELTPRQQRFVQEYMVDLNGTQAAIRAGYSRKTAQEQASRLLSNVMVRDAVEDAKDELRRKTMRRTQKILKQIDEMALADIDDIIDFNDEHLAMKREISREAKRTLRSVKATRRTVVIGDDGNITTLETVEIKMCDKINACRLALQYRGLLDVALDPIEKLIIHVKRIDPELGKFIEDRLLGADRPFDEPASLAISPPFGDPPLGPAGEGAIGGEVPEPG